MEIVADASKVDYVEIMACLMVVLMEVVKSVLQIPPPPPVSRYHGD